MKSRDRIITHTVMPILIFLFAYVLRRYFFSGFILGDDTQEFALSQHISGHGPSLLDQLHQRFGGWLVNSLFFKLLGVSEITFFLPTWIMSASLSVMAYYLLMAWKYRPGHSFLASLLVASAPFEVLIGSVHANDLILSWLLSLGLVCFVLFEKKPALQGVSVALCFWLAFYVKLWAIYALPALALYYFIRIHEAGTWRGLFVFCATSLLLHGITSIFWKIKVGLFLPFLIYHPGTFSVAAKDLAHVFLLYPRMIFKGSEFGTTFFGFIPYGLIFFLLIKIFTPFSLKKLWPSLQFDRPDLCLLIYYGSYSLLMNFFPHALKFDQYYTTTRIFRYLSPISFPMTLHLAKLILDVLVVNIENIKAIKLERYAAVSIFAPLLFINIYQANDATKPGQIYRKALLPIVKDLKEQLPPKLLAESWLSFFLKEVYLKEERNKIFIETMTGVSDAKDYEQWLEGNQSDLPDGTMLITGLSDYVHYGPLMDGLRLRLFANSLDSHWKLFKEYNMLNYLPMPEPARLWQWSGGTVMAGHTETVTSPKELPNISNPKELLEAGMAFFDKNDYFNAQMYYKKIVEEFPDSVQADNALYFYTICYFRQGEWRKTIDEFGKLIVRYPKSIWVPGAHYHRGLSYNQLQDIEKARKEFQYVIDNFPLDKNLVNLSKGQLTGLPKKAGILERVFK